MKPLLVLVTLVVLFSTCSGNKTSGSEDNLKTAKQAEEQFFAGNQGKAQEAIAAYQKVLSQNPDHREAFFGLARLYFRTGQKDKALQLMTQRAENNTIPEKERAAIWMVVADHQFRCESGQGEKKECFEKGLQTIERAMTLNPQSQLAWSLKCIFLRRLAEISTGEKAEYEKRSAEACSRIRTLNAKDDFEDAELTGLGPPPIPVR